MCRTAALGSFFQLVSKSYVDGDITVITAKHKVNFLFSHWISLCCIHAASTTPYPTTQLQRVMLSHKPECYPWNISGQSSCWLFMTITPPLKVVSSQKNQIPYYSMPRCKHNLICLIMPQRLQSYFLYPTPVWISCRLSFFLMIISLDEYLS